MERDIIQNILKMPVEFYSVGTKTLIDLFNESGYLQEYNDIEIEDLLLALRNNLKYLDKWIEYSENKRASYGWFIQAKNNEYLVGYLNEGYICENMNTFQDKAEACAFFIKMELESLRLSMEKNNN